MIKGNQQKNSQSSLMGWLLCLPIRILSWLLLCCLITQLLLMIFMAFLAHQAVLVYVDQLLRAEVKHFIDHIANLNWLGFLFTHEMHSLNSLQKLAQQAPTMNSIKRMSKNNATCQLLTN